jgi:hypothetical protein
MDDTHSVLYDLKLKRTDLYYQNNRYKNVGLDDSTCKTYLGGADFVADEAKSKFTETYCKNVFAQNNPLDNEVNECYNYSLCKNRDIAQQLDVKMGSKDSSGQNKKDSQTFYNIQLLQTMNLGVGMFLAIAGIIYINIKQGSAE